MSEDHRAILVSPGKHGEFTTSDVRDKWEAAVDHPRIRWCVAHKTPYQSDMCRAWPENPCRVVDAIVVPLEDS